MNRPVITLLTDFGLSDHYVGAMKGVMLGICAHARFVDISHDVTPYAISEGAFTLDQARRCFPAKTVHLVVVDPGVGSSRRPILAEAAGHYYVAPDNGVLSMVLESDPKHRVREITADRWFRKPVSRTFHGRDIFAPVAAHLASGAAASEFGQPIEDYLRLKVAKPVHVLSKRWVGAILKVDRFGNIVTNFDSETWARLATEPFVMKIAGRIVSRMASNYAEIQDGELFLIGGSAGFLEISRNQDSAAIGLAARSGDSIELELL